MFGPFKSKEKKRQDCLALWQPIMCAAQNAMPKNLPTLDKSHARTFIEEWNRLYEQSDESEKIGLAVLAYRVQIHRYAAAMLIDRKSDIRLSGIRILGYMRDETSWPILIRLLQHQDEATSATAMKALHQINERRLQDELSEHPPDGR